MKPKTFVEWIKENYLYLVLVFMLTILAGVLLFAYNYEIIYNVGTSMYPTLVESNRELFKKTFDEVERYDIVIISDNNGRISEIAKGYSGIAKRVIGLPGDTIEVKEGRVYVNGELDKYDIGELKNNNKIRDSFSLTLKKDEYFVCGDNRLTSYDNRNLKFGEPIKINEIEAVWVKTIINKSN